VVFYQGTNFIAATTNGPSYQISWAVTNSGTNTLHAWATDSAGATGTSFPVTVTVKPPNQPPVVYAGPNQTTNLPAPTVQLTGFVSDDGLPSNTLAMVWTLLSGPTNGTVTFSNSYQPVTTATFNTNGTYILQLAASDGQYTSTSAVVIVVLIHNSPPVVYAGTNQTIILPALPNTNPVPTINLTPLVAGFTELEGVDYFIASNCIIVSDCIGSQTPNPSVNFGLIAINGTNSAFHLSITNSGLEPAIAIVRNGLGGFTIGEMFCGNGNPGEILRIEPDGTVVGTAGKNTNAWIVLTTNQTGIDAGVIEGALNVDRTGVWGGDLIVATESGHIYRIKSNGQYQMVAGLLEQFPDAPEYGFEGLITIPNDPAKYGPWAGRILVGGETFTDNLYAVYTNGVALRYDLGVYYPGDIRLIPENENFYGAYEGLNTLFGAAPSEFQGMTGDILIASEANSEWRGPPNGVLYRIHWNGSAFETHMIASEDGGYGAWEQVNFAPVGILSMSAVNSVQLQGAVTDDGCLFSPTSNLWVEVSGPGPVTFADPTQTTTTASLTVPGDYVLRLTAYDGEFTSYSNVTIHALRNQAPVVTLTNQIISTTNTTLSGSVSDDGWPSNQLTLTWSMVSGPLLSTVTFNPTNQVINGTNAVVTSEASFSSGGSGNTYVLRLTASDGQATSSAEVIVNVETPTLTLTPAYGWPTRTNVPYTVTARLVDMKGIPITNQPLSFTLGIDGSQIGSATTDSNGYASITYTNPSTISARTPIAVGAPTMPGPHPSRVSVFKDWAADISCGQTIAHQPDPDHGCLSVDWPTNNPRFADYYLYAGTAGTAITLSYIRTDGYPSVEALILRDPSKNVVAVSENGLLNYTLPLSGDYLIEVAEMSAGEVTPAYNLSLLCNGGSLNPTNGLQVLYNGTNVPNFGIVVFPQTTNVSTNISLTISNASANVLQVSGSIDSDYGFYSFTITNDEVSYSIDSHCSTNLIVSYTRSPFLPLRCGVLKLMQGDGSGYRFYRFYVNLLGNDCPTGAPPSIQLVSPPDGTVFYAATPSDTVPINITAVVTPPTNLNYVMWTEDGDFNGPITNNTPIFTNLYSAVFATEWDVFAGVTNHDLYGNTGYGDHCFSATVVDKAGRSATVGPVMIHVGTAPPLIQVLYNGTNIPNNGTIAFPLTATNVSATISLVITNPGAVALQITDVRTNSPFTNGIFALLNNVSRNTVYSDCATNLNIRLNTPSNGVTYGTLSFGARGINGGRFTVNLVGNASPTGAPPVVQMVSPANNSTFYDTTPLLLSAAVTSAVTNISYVTFQALTPNGPVNLGQSTNSPYVLRFANVPDGDYTLTAVAVDAAGRSGVASPVIIHIVPANGTNQLPVAVNDEFTVQANSHNNIRDLLANDSNPGASPLTIVVLQPPATTNHGTATIVDNGTRISYTPAPNLRSPVTNGVTYPADGFSYQISDGKGGSSWGSVLVNVFATDIPTVTLTNYPSSATAGTLVPLVAYVTPSQFITKVDFYLGQTFIGEATNGVNGLFTNYWAALYDDCGCGFTAQATDAFGQINTSPEININVTRTGLSGSLTAALDSMTGSSGTNQFTNGVLVRDGVFNLYGRAIHSLGSNVVWQLGVYTPDGTTLIRNLTPAPLDNNGYHSGLVGTTSTPGLLLTNCDLTALQNGVYDLRLTVAGGYQMTNTDVLFRLESNLKIGQFSFSQQDLIIPVNGIPLTVVRTYNSINPNRGDFGYGWFFAINSMDIALDETREDVPDVASGKGEGDSPSGTFSMRTGGGYDVTLTMPNGQRTTFYFYLTNTEAFTYNPAWSSAPGITATLTAQGNPVLQYFGDGSEPYWSDNDPDTFNVPFDNYDFQGFILKTRDGTVYKINRDYMGNHGVGINDSLVNTYGPPSLAEIDERSGDTIIIAPNAITHIVTNGAQKQVKIQRNSDGLITSITDPNGQASNSPPAVKYEYDSYDNLMYVERLVDRTGSGTYVTNSFSYTNANFPHYITGIINADGTQVAENFYDSSGKLIAVQDADGKLTRFIHNPTNNMEVVIDRLGNNNTYVYDTRGNVTNQINALNQVTTMAYDANNNKTNQVTYLNGQPYAINSYLYDGNNLLLVSTDPLGYTNSFIYDSFGDLTISTDARGNSSTYTYDNNTGNLISTTDALVHGTTNSYNNGLLTSSSDPIGTLTTNYYDNFGNLTNSATLDASGTIVLSISSFVYDANGNRTSSTIWRRVGSGWTPAITTYIYDAMNRVTQTIDPDGGTNTVIYDLNGKQQTTIDKLGRTTSYFYDAQGRLFQTTYPDNTKETSAYDANGNRTNSVDRLSHVTSYSYDALNRLTNTLYADLTGSTTVYDGVGRVAQTIDALGNITAFAYDAAGRRLAVTNAVGVTNIQTVSSFGYDATGNQIYFTNALGNVTTNVFDALNRQVQSLFPDGTQTGTAYDAAGRRVAETNQDGIVSAFGYDGAGRLIAMTNALGTAQPLFALYQYDEAGNEIAQVDALNRTNTFQYDGLGRCIQHSMPGGQVERFSYDLAGNLGYATNFNGVIIANQYDVMNRLTNRASVNGYKVSYTYTSTGQRQTMIDPNGTTTYLYDNRDRLTNKVVNWGSPAQLSVSLNYSYDANGNLANLWSSTANGVTNIYQYDALNRLTNVVGQASSLSQYSYDLAGNLQTMRYGNGVTNLYQYDTLNRLTNSVWKLNAGTLASFYYQLGLTGNRTGVIEFVKDSWRTNQWQYDPLYRMTYETIRVGAASDTLGYSYDPVGNRTNRTSTSGLSGWLPSVTNSFTTNDWLKTDAYDNNGNTLWSTNGTIQGPYYYDVENRLTNFNNTIYIAYNGDGHRVRKISGTTTNYYLVDDRNPSGYAQVLEEHQALSGQSPALKRVYNYGLDLVSQREAVGTVYYFGYDGHGSTRLLLDTSGIAAQKFSYDAYGTLIDSNAAPATVYLYCGEQFDTDLGFYYLRAPRYLNPGTGRFTTMDTSVGNNEDPLSLHKYLYCQGNPVNGSDPSGNDFEMAGLLTGIRGIGSIVSFAVSGVVQAMNDAEKVAARRPSSTKFWEAYHKVDFGTIKPEVKYKVWEFIGGNVGAFGAKPDPNGNVSETCATRVSYGLNYGGNPIPSIPHVSNLNFRNQFYKNKPGDNMRYILKAGDMNAYLTRTWGNPDYVALANSGTAKKIESGLLSEQCAVFATKQTPGHSGVIKKGYQDPDVDGFDVDVWELRVP
jgi:RHS repeat-associated protein